MTNGRKPTQGRWGVWLLNACLLTGTLLGGQAQADPGLIPDGTLGTEASVINDLDSLTQRVEGGAMRGGNLFHSFLEFNVAPGREVYFANPAAVESILTRVTGDNPSAILGRLGVLGDANLLLLNPNGLVFGEAASLDVNGSFYASTAEAIPLGEGVFSATEPESSRLLAVDPAVTFFNYLGTGLGDISNSGDLSVGDGETLTLLGAAVLSDGLLSAPGGTVQVLGNLVGLVDQATVNVSGADGGGTVLVGGDYQGQGIVPTAERTTVGSEVVITADALETGDGGRVIVWADDATRFAGNISARGGEANGDGGFVEVSGLESLSFTGLVDTQAIQGEAGELLLDPAAIVISDTAPIGFTTVDNADGVFNDFLFGEAENIGQSSHITPETIVFLLDLNDLTLEATDFIRVDSNIDSRSTNDFTLRAGAIGIFASVSKPAGGDIVLETPQASENNFVLIDGGRLSTSTFFGSMLDSGNIAITTYDLELRNFGSINTSASSQANEEQVRIRAAGDVTVNRSSILNRVSSLDIGNGGGIDIQARNLSVLNSAEIGSSTLGEENAGGVRLDIVDEVIIDGPLSRVTSEVLPFSDGGNSSGINITTGRLSIRDGGSVRANTFSQGDSGGIRIVAIEDISLSNNSFIDSEVFSADGDSGDIDIVTGSLSIRDNAFIVVDTSGEGDSGNIRIVATEDIILENSSVIASRVIPGADGNSGDIDITTRNLSIRDNSVISALTAGTGDSGLLRILSAENIVVEGENSGIVNQVFQDATGSSNDIEITTTNLSVFDGAVISTSTNGENDSGTLKIIATGDITLRGENSALDSQVRPNAFGNSGGIDITTAGLSILDGASVDTRIFGKGDSGEIKILAIEGVNLQNNSFIDSGVLPDAVGNSGDIDIIARNLEVLNSSAINSSSQGQGNSGAVRISAVENIVVEGPDSVIFAIFDPILQNLIGNSGDIEITTNNLSILNGAKISATTDGEGNSGMIKVIASGNILISDPQSFLVSQVGTNAIGNSGGIYIEADNLLVANGAILGATTAGMGNSGVIKIVVTDDLVVRDASSFLFSEVQGATGDSQGIDIMADNLFVLEDARIGAATFGEGDAGRIKIVTSGDILIQDSGTSIGSEVGPEAIGTSNGIEIITNNISILEGANVSTSTFGQGNAGPIIVQSNSGSNLTVLVSEDSAISTATGSEGDGGGLTIMSDENLTIQGPGELSTESVGTNAGTAGNLNIFADSVLLDDGVELSTQTASVAGGGNINFQVDEGIILRQGSFINAESTNENPGSGSGGNINLDANFVIAIPAENSDIIANAVGGDGGNILVNAAGIFGFTEQGNFQTTDALRANRSSDISASSQSGQQGSISLNADFEQTQTLDELPDSFINADQLVASSCIARSGNSDGAFVIAGSGGLAQQPDDAVGVGYSTGAVQTMPEARVSQTLQEPEGVYQLADGRLVMSYECETRLQDSSLDIN